MIEHIAVDAGRKLLGRQLPRAEAFRLLSHAYLCGDCRKLLRGIDENGFSELMLMLAPEEERHDSYPVIDDPNELREQLDGMRQLFKHLSSALETYGGGRLRGLTEAQLWLIAENLKSEQLGGLFIALDSECRDLVIADPQGARDLAKTGLDILKHRRDRLLPGFDTQYYDAILLAHWGNALRAIGNLRTAIWALRQAERLSHATPDPVCRGWTLRFLATALADSRQFQEALALSRDAKRMFVSIGDTAEAANQQFFNAYLLGSMGKTVASTDLLLKLRDEYGAIGSLEGAIQSSLVWNHLRAGNAWAARGELTRLKRLPCEGVTAARVKWLEALVLEGLNQLEDAKAVLDDVLRYFRGHDYAVDTAIAAIDMVRLCLRQGQRQEILKLLTELWPFLNEGLHEEAVRAIGLLRQTIDLGSLSRDLLTSVRSFLDASQRDPGYTLEAAGIRGEQ